MRRITFALIFTLMSVFVGGSVASAAQPRTSNTPLVVTVAPSTVATGTTATVTGTHYTANNYAYVYYQRPDGTSNAFYVYTDNTGSFSFTLGFSAVHGTGTEYVSAYDYATARWAPFALVTVTSGMPTTLTRTLSALPTHGTVNSQTVVTGSSFTPNQYVYVAFQRPDGTSNSLYVFTDYNGSFSFTLGFLASHGCGTETVQAYDYGSSAYSSPYTIPVGGC